MIRAKTKVGFKRIYSHPVDKETGLRCDQTIGLTGSLAGRDYPQSLRRVKFYDEKTNKCLVFLTNNFDLPALVISKLYKSRWQVELFFKWIKQHLRIKAFLERARMLSKRKFGLQLGVTCWLQLLRNA